MATALGNTSSGTTSGRNACAAGPLKLRTTPFKTSAAYTGHTDVRPRRVNVKSPADTHANAT